MKSDLNEKEFLPWFACAVIDSISKLTELFVYKGNTLACKQEPNAMALL